MVSAAASGTDPPTSTGGSQPWEPPTDPGRSRPWLLAVVAVLVALLVAVDSGELAVESRPDGNELAVNRDGERSLPAAPGGDVLEVEWQRPEPGTWRTLPPAPIGSRTGHVVADLGGRVIVWGGSQHRRALRNGALLDPRTGRWTQIPDSPAVQRRHVPVVAGRTLLLLDDERPQAFSLDDSRWTELPAPPQPAASRLTTVSAWTGRAAVVATALDDGTAGPLLAWDTERSSWATLAAPPGRVDDTMAMVWNGGELLLFGDGGAGFAHKLRLTDRARPAPHARWEPLPPPDLRAEVLQTASVRALSTGALRGDDVYLWVVPREGADRTPRLLAYNGRVREGPSAEPPTPWSLVPEPPLPLVDPELVLLGDDLVALAPLGAVRFRPGSDAMVQLPPADIPPFQYRDAASSRGRIVWWGGGAGDGAVWRPELPELARPRSG